MNDNLDQLVSRRSFLRRGACSALGLYGLTSQMFTLRATASVLDGLGLGDHRALVCIFLFGGNDNGNTLIPIDGGEENYETYAAIRAQLALPRNVLDPTVVTPANTGGRRFAFHPSLSAVKSLFDQGDLAVLANVGSLVFPMNREQYYDGSVEKPPSLFAHNVQQEQWQISTADAPDRLGWAGRVADALQSSGVNPSGRVSMNVSLAGNNFFQTGRSISPFVMGTNGAPQFNFNGIGNSGDRREVVAAAFADLMALQCDGGYPDPHLIQKVYADVNANAIVDNAFVDMVLSRVELATQPPEGNQLAAQLHMIARMIKSHRALNQDRQIFFCAMGGFDNHDGLVGGQGQHAGQLATLDAALAHFWEVLGEIGKRDAVTTFTASDFGRTMTSNDDGSDHGWGGHHLVMGGSQLDGGKVYGDYPTLAIEGPEDTKRGRYIPTTSVDAYGYEMARWLGLPASDATTVFPNLTRFLDPNDHATHLGMLG